MCVFHKVLPNSGSWGKSRLSPFKVYFSFIKKKTNIKMFANFNLVEEMEKWSDEIFFCLIENKNEKIENVVCINLLSYPSI